MKLLFQSVLLMSSPAFAADDPWLSVRLEVPYPPFGTLPSQGVLVRIWNDGKIERAFNQTRPADGIATGQLKHQDFSALRHRFTEAWRRDFESRCSLSPDGAFQKLGVTVNGKHFFFQCNIGQEPMVQLNKWIWDLSIEASDKGKSVSEDTHGQCVTDSSETVGKEKAISVATESVRSRMRNYEEKNFVFSANFSECEWHVRFENLNKQLGRTGEVVISSSGKELRYMGGM